MEWAVEKRTGKIFIDYNMNVRGKTLNVAYSPRGVPGAPVSMPLTLGGARGGRADGVYNQATYPPGWKRPATGGMMYLRQNRALRRLSVLIVRSNSLSRQRPSHRARRCTHGRTFHRFSDGVLRSGRHSGEALHRDAVGERHLLQPAAQDRRLAPEAAVRVSEGGCGRRARRDGQGLRVRQGPVRARSRRRRSRRWRKSAATRWRSPSSCPSSRSTRCYYDKTYYLAPDKGAAKPYALLTEALRQARRCGVGRWAARGKGYIVILRPIGEVLAMQQLHYAADVRRASEVDVPKTEVKPAELKLAQQLIDQQTAEKFDAESLPRRGARAHRGRHREEGRGQGDLGSRDRAAGRGQGDRSHGGAARQPAAHRERARQVNRLGPRKAAQARRGSRQGGPQGGQASRLSRGAPGRDQDAFLQRAGRGAGAAALP